jgi:hypothetical protein
LFNLEILIEFLASAMMENWHRLLAPSPKSNKEKFSRNHVFQEPITWVVRKPWEGRKWGTTKGWGRMGRPKLGPRQGGEIG